MNVRTTVIASPMAKYALFIRPHSLRSAGVAGPEGCTEDINGLEEIGGGGGGRGRGGEPSAGAGFVAAAALCPAPVTPTPGHDGSWCKTIVVMSTRLSGTCRRQWLE